MSKHTGLHVKKVLKTQRYLQVSEVYVVPQTVIADVNQSVLISYVSVNTKKYPFLAKVSNNAELKAWQGAKEPKWRVYKCSVLRLSSAEGNVIVSVMWIHQKACLHTSVTDTMSYATRAVSHWSVSDVGHICLQKTMTYHSMTYFFFFNFLWPLFKRQIRGISLSIKIEEKHLHHQEIICCEFRTSESVCSVFETWIWWSHFYLC